MKGNIKINLVGRGPMTLRESNYVTSGGEGSIYLAGETVIKLFADPAKMKRDGMADKIKALSKIQHQSIVTPSAIVTDEKDQEIGFYMPKVDGEPMPRVFTADYRALTGFDDEAAKKVTAQMWGANKTAHAAGAVMVDANEFNWIVEGAVPKVIDVDSWAIGKWPATVIMPSIRDWNAKGFDAMSDWFSWGVVAFQIFTGIHPYKGKLDGYKAGELERRMKDGASVFTAGVRLPASVRDLSCIPAPLLEWFRHEFQDGARTEPPSPFDGKKAAQAAKIMRSAVGQASGFVHEKVFLGLPDAVRTWPCGVAMLKDRTVFDMATGGQIGALDPDDEVVRAGAGFLLAHQSPGITQLAWYSGGALTQLKFGLATRRLFRSGERLFVVTDTELVEIVTKFPSGRPVATIGQRWSVRPNATRWFDGVAVQDVLGASFLVMPVDAGVVQPRIPELDGLTPLAGVGEGRFACILASDRQGNYHRVEVTFDPGYASHKVWKGPNDGPELNMTVLPKGLVATIVNDGEVVIFVPANGKVNHVQDGLATTALRLSRWDDRVTYIKDGAVWHLQSK